MVKFAVRAERPPILTTNQPTWTFEAGAGYSRDPESELFLTAVSNLVGEDTFYETARARDSRYAALVHQVTVEDPAWLAALVPWLRNTMNLRSVAVVTAAEYVAAGGPNGRTVVAAALERADEPAEMLGYWFAAHGRNIPKPVKRGVADAARRLYTQRAALRYDGTNKAFKFRDVLRLAHPRPRDAEQAALFRYLTGGDGHSLPAIAADTRLRALPENMRRAALNSADFAMAGWSWERLSGWLPGGMDAEAWAAVIPHMGIMARLRNLRNFDETGVPDSIVAPIVAQFSNPDEIARSKQLPFRWYSAWREAGSLRWAYPLEQALDASLANVPSLPGRTLVLVDVSGSMHDRISFRSERQRWELASLFGFALAKRAQHADIVLYNNRAFHVDHRGPVLKLVDETRPLVGGGTNTWGVLDACYDGHDRVVILTDEQADGRPSARVEQIPRLYTFNLAGYAPAHIDATGRRHTFGGLSDAGFTLLAAVETHKNGRWPHLEPTEK